ncbi:MAG: hypothetical protein QM831_32295 [Kofleriaceae bacterium]
MRWLALLLVGCATPMVASPPKVVAPPRVDEQLAPLLGTWTDDAGVTFDVLSVGDRVKIGDVVVYASGQELRAIAPVQLTCVVDAMTNQTLEVIANTDEITIRGAGIDEHFRVTADRLDLASNRGAHVFRRVR